jgi:CHASE2 domain-containing sensor protein
VQVGSTFLGSGDIAYAALAAALIVGFKLGWVRTLVVGGVYAAAALSLAALAVHSGQSVPATAPGLLAVLSAAALAEVRRRSLRNSGAVFNA